MPKGIHKTRNRIKEAIVKLSDEELNRIVRVLCDLRPEEFNKKGLAKPVLTRDARLILLLRHFF
ncbi:MAG: hypothetical protein ACXVIZ_11040 [Halobacteriota archaeon]